MARFLKENFDGHLDRWSPPTVAGFFTEGFWRDRLDVAVEEFHGGRAARFVLQQGPPDGPILGTCNYTNIVRGPFLACYLGYQVARQHEGHGFMAEALRITNTFMFESQHLHRIMANYRPENARSAKLLERLGFVKEGVAREYLFIDGAWRDHVLTSLTNPALDPAAIEPAGR